jgi:hypothetical protein
MCTGKNDSSRVAQESLQHKPGKKNATAIIYLLGLLPIIRKVQCIALAMEVTERAEVYMGIQRSLNHR